MTNDTFQDFIDGHLVITGNDKDRISKDGMLELFRDVYPKKHMSPTVLLSALKDKDLTYSSQYRHKSGVRGVYYGVKVKDQDDEPQSESLMYHGVSVKEHKKALDKIEELQKQIEELKKQLQQQQPLNFNTLLLHHLRQYQLVLVYYLLYVLWILLCLLLHLCYQISVSVLLYLYHLLSSMRIYRRFLLCEL
jgi:hypothetical protein